MKFWTVYLVSVYVKEKSCNETHFELFNIVWQVFPRFYVDYTEVIVLNLLCFGKELEVQELP